MRTNDVKCLELILRKMGDQDTYKISQGTIKVLLGLDADETRKAVL